MCLGSGLTPHLAVTGLTLHMSQTTEYDNNEALPVAQYDIREAVPIQVSDQPTLMDSPIPSVQLDGCVCLSQVSLVWVGVECWGCRFGVEYGLV